MPVTCVGTVYREETAPSSEASTPAVPVSLPLLYLLNELTTYTSYYVSCYENSWLCPKETLKHALYVSLYVTPLYAYNFLPLYLQKGACWGKSVSGAVGRWSGAARQAESWHGVTGGRHELGHLLSLSTSLLCHASILLPKQAWH